MRSTTSRGLIAIGVLALAISAGGVSADMLGPGTYHGYVYTDRWGQHVFHNGPYHFFMTKEVADDLAKYRGKPLALHVTQMSQPMNPGAGMIRGFDEVSVEGILTELTLTAKPDSTTVTQGKSLWLRMSVRNDSKEDVTVWLGGFRVVLVTNSPFSNDAIGYKDPENRAYWYHTARYLDFARPRDKAPPPTVACRQITFAWDPRRLVARGEGMQQSTGEKVMIAPGGGFEVSAGVGSELLPGTYEVLFYYAHGGFSGAATPMSDRIAFDVVAPEE